MLVNDRRYYTSKSYVCEAVKAMFNYRETISYVHHIHLSVSLPLSTLRLSLFNKRIHSCDVFHLVILTGAKLADGGCKPSQT